MKSHQFIVVVLFLAFSLVSVGYGQQSAEQLYQSALYKEEIEGEMDAAIKIYETIVKQYPDNRPVAAKALLHFGICKERLGLKEAQLAYELVVRDYADQAEPTKLARERLNILSGGKAAANISSEASMRRIWVAGKNQPLGVSPNGRYVVFGMNDTGDLWLRDLQSGEQRQITREGSWVDWTYASDAAISPDGKQIAYSWTVRSFGELRLSALDGSSMRVLHNGQDGRWMYISTWMPDGQRILASSYNLKDKTNQRQIISLSDGSIHNIGQPELEAIDWGYPSPDGRYIAYGLRGDIFVHDTMTKKDSVLIQNPSKDSMVGWMKDGSGILFVSDRSGTRDLYLQEIKNGRSLGGLELLRLNLIASQNPNFTTSNLNLTTDGRLFQLENTGTTNAYISPFDETTGKVTDTQSLVDQNYPRAAWTEWSPDGKLLYYEIFKDPQLNERLLFIRSEETGQTREISLKPKLRYWYRPILSPDGKQFAVTGTGENYDFGIFAIDRESGEVSQLARIPDENNPVDPSQNWSPDGKAIFYKVRSPEESEEFIIRRKDLITGEEKDIYRGMHTRDMKISSDGTRFVYFRNDRPTKSYVLGILDIKSGKESELWRVPEADSPEISGPTWAPDGKHILVAKSLKQGSELWRFPVDGGPGEKLYSNPESTWGFVMHPSGKRMAFTQSRTNYELWVLENFLPK
ncbi:MAG TPA: hypothetical protein DDW27_05240 [Bacteroidales bacterium]|jgi:Tol biopolymer transport system component|nr:hypothetical protein [Bacteroidales bacterium]